VVACDVVVLWAGVWYAGRLVRGVESGDDLRMATGGGYRLHCIDEFDDSPLLNCESGQGKSLSTALLSAPRPRVQGW
jgi:hypothetical protein